MSCFNFSEMDESLLRDRFTAISLDPIIGPNNCGNEIFKKAYNHARVFISHVNQFHHHHKRGITFCHLIHQLNLHTYTNLEYPPNLRIYVESLCDAWLHMKESIELMNNISLQCKALAKLELDLDPMLYSWSAMKLSESTKALYDMYAKELDKKRLTKENIAHCRDEILMEIYVTAWGYNTLIDRKERNSFIMNWDSVPNTMYDLQIM